ncbi:hypothetical protein [Pontibacter mangrovi]|uniref:Uncharacterized protein n=1 Tax=Pontibacter mangrovi TaxID=2589816 RepID=A0A501W4S4_9BACT|nr:hypothetical protein [Pontibacter mangrovi]TPE44943.1 hypothetical protein FJM65_07975 [Pontibacter mangrovi]
MQTPEDYIQELASRFTDLKHVGFGYGDEQGEGGHSAYPQLFQEAEMEIRETNPGLDSYSVALLLLDLPAEQGTQPGTRAEKEILQRTKRMADAFTEQIRLEGVLMSLRVMSMLSLVAFNDDAAYGWRVELSFEYPKYVDRQDIQSRFTPR